MTIEHNRFDFFRHVVAGSGEPGQDYTARDNLVLSDAIDHVFDMHGQNETNPGATGSEFAGGEILIHGNTVLVRWHPAMVIRGRPETGAWMYDNCLACKSEESCWEQLHFTGNVHVDQSPTTAPAPNKYKQGGSSIDGMILSCSFQQYFALSGFPPIILSSSVELHVMLGSWDPFPLDFLMLFDRHPEP